MEKKEIIKKVRVSSRSHEGRLGVKPRLNHSVKDLKVPTPPSASMPYRLALLVSIMIMSLDIHVPALSSMVDYFHSDEQTLQLTISLTSLGFFIAGPIVGPMADAWRRRLMLWLCLIFFVISSIGSYLAPNLELLLFARFIQGLSAAGTPILVMTMISDWYTHKRFVQMGSLVGMVITFSLACAPVIGGHLSIWFGWRSVFLFLVAACVIGAFTVMPFLSESLKEKRPFSLKQSFHDYKDMLSSWSVVGHALIPALLIGVIIAHVSVASYYFIDHLHIEPSHYGYFQAVGTCGNVLFCLFTSHWSMKFGWERVLKGGVLMAGFGGIVFLLVAHLMPENPYLLTLPTFIVSASIAMVFSSSLAYPMQLFGKQAATLSALVAAIRMLVISASASVAGYLYQGNAQSLTVVFGIGILLTLITFASVQHIHFDERYKSVRLDGPDQEAA